MNAAPGTACRAQERRGPANPSRVDTSQAQGAPQPRAAHEWGGRQAAGDGRWQQGAGPYCTPPPHLDNWGQAVGGAGGCRDDVVVSCAVQVLRAGESTWTAAMGMAGLSQQHSPAAATPLGGHHPPACTELCYCGWCAATDFCRPAALLLARLTWLTPYTMLSTGCGSFTGADTTTFLQPCTGGGNHCKSVSRHSGRTVSWDPPGRRTRGQHSTQLQGCVSGSAAAQAACSALNTPARPHLVKEGLQLGAGQKFARALERDLHAQPCPVHLRWAWAATVHARTPPQPSGALAAAAERAQQMERADVISASRPSCSLSPSHTSSQGALPQQRAATHICRAGGL